MPKKPSNYKNCVIYKLVCYDTSITDCYVGATTNFKQRKSYHKNSYINPNNQNHFCPVYIFMRENGGWNNFKMVEIEKFPCETKRQAELREEYWRKELNATLNGQQAFLTDEEKRKKNRESVKRYSERHPEKIQKYKQDYYIKNKERFRKKYQKKIPEIPETIIIEN